MTSDEREKLVSQLVRHEGLRLRPYTDTVGKLTIGVGRNLTDRGITQAEAFYLLKNDIDMCLHQLTASFPWFVDLDPVRQRVWLDLCFNMGITKLYAFKRTLSAMVAGQYEVAAAALEDSKWFTQVGRRGPWIVEALRTGVEPTDGPRAA
jgi:lysozyme